jgi:hypothetical protein
VISYPLVLSRGAENSNVMFLAAVSDVAHTMFVVKRPV